MLAPSELKAIISKYLRIITFDDGGAKSAIGIAKRNLIITCLGQINNLYEGHKHKVITAKAPTPSKTFGVGWFANETTRDKILSQHGHNVGYVINPIVKPC